MRQRQRGSSGVENAPTCMGGLGLPSTPAVPSTPRPATASSATAEARGLGEFHIHPPAIQLLAVNFLIAASASSAVAISTKPKPRERPVSRSVATAADSTVPAWAKTSRSRSLDVEKDRPPMKSFCAMTPPLMRFPAVEDTPWYAEDCARELPPETACSIPSQ